MADLAASTVIKQADEGTPSKDKAEQEMTRKGEHHKTFGLFENCSSVFDQVPSVEYYAASRMREIADLARLQCTVPGVHYVVTREYGDPHFRAYDRMSIGKFLEKKFTLIRKETGEQVLASDEFRFCRMFQVPPYRYPGLTLHKLRKELKRMRKGVEHLCPYTLPALPDGPMADREPACGFLWVFVWHGPRSSNRSSPSLSLEDDAHDFLRSAVKTEDDEQRRSAYTTHAQ